MILRYSRFSPFVRKVRVCAAELGLADAITLHECNPHEDESLRLLNPLCKVPTLVLDNGGTLFDSRVICAYLSHRAGDARIIPASALARITVACDEALGDGISDAAVALRAEKLRPKQRQDPTFVDRQIRAIGAGCDWLEARTPTLQDRLDIGVIAIACALGYLDLRHPELDWRRGRGKLERWHSAFEKQASMQQAPYPSTK
jgi:glutathione S-transferase